MKGNQPTILLLMEEIMHHHAMYKLPWLELGFFSYWFLPSVVITDIALPGRTLARQGQRLAMTALSPDAVDCCLVFTTHQECFSLGSFMLKWRVTYDNVSVMTPSCE